MSYKSLSLVMFAMFFGWNISTAQVGPCDRIDEIATAVGDVMAPSGCDAEILREAPNALNVHPERLVNWCGNQDKPLNQKFPTSLRECPKPFRMPTLVNFLQIISQKK